MISRDALRLRMRNSVARNTGITGRTASGIGHRPAGEARYGLAIEWVHNPKTVRCFSDTFFSESQVYDHKPEDQRLAVQILQRGTG